MSLPETRLKHSHFKDQVRFRGERGHSISKNLSLAQGGFLNFFLGKREERLGKREEELGKREE